MPEEGRYALQGVIAFKREDSEGTSIFCQYFAKEAQEVFNHLVNSGVPNLKTISYIWKPTPSTEQELYSGLHFFEPIDTKALEDWLERHAIDIGVHTIPKIKTH